MKRHQTFAQATAILLAVSTAAFAQVTPGGQVTPGKPLPWNAQFPGTGANIFVKGTTAQRPLVPKLGMFRYNVSLNTWEGYNGIWTAIPGSGGGSGGGEHMPAAALSVAGTAIPGINFCDAVTAGFNVTIPSAAGIAGTIIELKKVDNSFNAVTLVMTGGQTIDNAPGLALVQPNQAITLVSDGSNWKIK